MRGLTRTYNPTRLFLSMALCIFGVETAIMLVLETALPLPPRVRPLADAGALVVILSPLLYLLFFRPLVATIRMRAKAEEELRKTHDQLELRVQERTSQLAEANEQLKCEIVVRRRVEIELRNSQETLRKLSAAMLEAQEQERRRIARELHDSIGQSLTAVKHSVEHAAQQCVTEDGEPNPALQAVVPEIVAAIEELKRVSRDLRPTVLDDIGVVAALTWYCRTFRQRYARLEVVCDIDLVEEEVPERLKTVIYRMTQEALTNVVKHSNARQVELRLWEDDSGLRLRIRDDGKGIPEASTAAQSPDKRGIGLEAMHERVEYSGGTLEVRSTPGKGTRVEALWPPISAE